MAAVRLSQAGIRGYLLLDGATRTNRSGPALREASITGTLSLERATVVSYPVRVEAGGAGPGSEGGAVGLSGATIGGDLVRCAWRARTCTASSGGG